MVGKARRRPGLREPRARHVLCGQRGRGVLGVAPGSAWAAWTSGHVLPHTARSCRWHYGTALGPIAPCGRVCGGKGATPCRVRLPALATAWTLRTGPLRALPVHRDGATTVSATSSAGPGPAPGSAWAAWTMWTARALRPHPTATTSKPTGASITRTAASSTCTS
jgi:hypothetical protein